MESVHPAVNSSNAGAVRPCSGATARSAVVAAEAVIDVLADDDAVPVAGFLAQSRSIYELFGGPIRLVGLVNEGSQCYRNVLLQALLTLPTFIDKILDHDVRTGTIVYSPTAYQQFRDMVFEVARGHVFQPAVHSFRGGYEEDVLDYFQKLVVTDLLGFASQFRGSYNVDSRCPVDGCIGRSFQYAEAMKYLTVSINRRDRVSYALRDWIVGLHAVGSNSWAPTGS